VTTRVWAELARPRLLPPVCSAALAGACLAPAPWEPVAAAAAAAGLLLAFSGSSALSDVYAAPLDAVLHPSRPIPAGRVERRLALAAGYGALALSVALAGAAAAAHGAGGVVTAAGAALVLAGAAILRETAAEGSPAAPALQALCRGLAYLTAAAAVSGSVTWQPVMAAAVLAAYAAGLSGACEREEGAQRLWPLLLLLAPFLAAAPALTGGLWQSVLWFGTLAWVTRGLLGILQRDFDDAWPRLYSATPLIDALLISQAGFDGASVLVACVFPLTFALLRRSADR
jgi:hypothetical protein